MKKIFSLTAIIVLSVFALSTCYMGSEILSFQFYNEQNRNGFQVVELIPGALPGGNLHRLSFGVSSRQVHEGVLVNTGGRGGNITPWGCVIRDTMDIYDIAFKEAMAARFPASPDERRIQITAINETNNAGKIAGSEDGIAFYFVEVDKETNFRLSADFYIENYGFTRGRADHNGQEAFGIMARDFIPLYEDNGGGHSSTMDVLKTVNWNGVYWNGQDTSLNDGVGGSSNMIMVGGVKRGARVYWRTGVEDPAGLREPIEDPSAIADASFARFHFLPREFVDYSMYGTGQDGLERRPDFPSAGLTYKLMLEKTNSGFIARIEPPSGIGKGVTKDREIKDGEILHYTDRELPFPDLLFEVEKNLYYVGFFASRDARVIISNIRYEESPVHMCPPRVDLEPERFLPTFAVQSPSEVSTSDYILYARSNVEGYMALSINGGESIIYEGEWIIEPTNASAEPLNLFRVPEIDLNNGDNNFSMIFYPCPIQKRSQYLNPRGDPRNQQFLANVAPIFSSFKVNFRSIVTDDGNIWVSPDGRANGAGTRENPMDIRTAIAIVAPGQTIMMMDGIYTPVEPPMLVDGVMRIPIRMVIPRFNSGR
ncbi:MAG: hypothetical protein LBC80_06225, partial [Treponema sp.]|nr:hypothetical protein [Treponema sp.]